MTAHALDTDAFVGEVDGVPVGLVTITGGAGLSLSICTYGARWLQALVPDAEGVVRDVVWAMTACKACAMAYRPWAPSLGVTLAALVVRPSPCRGGLGAYPPMMAPTACMVVRAVVDIRFFRWLIKALTL